jgi:hypothetical protein
MVFFNVQAIADYVIWQNIKIPHWLDSLIGCFGLNYLLGWGIWWITMAVFLEAILIRLDNYWIRIAISFSSVVILAGIGNALRYFSPVHPINIFVGSITYAVFSIPYTALLTIVIFMLKNRSL